MKLLYKNVSDSAKTFYGVTFKPGEVKEVPGYVNHRKMIRVDESALPKVTPAAEPKKVKPVAPAPKVPQPVCDAEEPAPENSIAEDVTNK